MTGPTTRPARRILAVVTIAADREGRRHVYIVTEHGATRDSAATTRDALAKAAAIVAGMTDEEADRA